MKNAKEHGTHIARLMELDELVIHRSTICQKAQKDLGMTSKEFWEGFKWLKSCHYIRLRKNTKSYYYLTPTGLKLCQKNLAA